MEVLSLEVFIQCQIFMYIIMLLSDACIVANEIIVKLMFHHNAIV